MTPESSPSHRMASLETSSNDAGVVWTLTYACLIAATALLLMSGWLPAPPSMESAGQLFLLALIALTLRGWMGAWILALCQVHLLFLGNAAGEASSLFWAVLSLVLVAFTCRYSAMTKSAGISPTATYKTLIQLVKTGALTKPETIGNVRAVFRQVLRMLAVLAGCGIAAFMILKTFPVYRDAEVINTIGEFRLKPIGFRLIMLGLVLFSVWLVTWLIAAEMSWRRLTPEQAKLYLRSTFLGWCYVDLRMVVRRRGKARRLYARRNARPFPSSDSPAPDTDDKPSLNSSAKQPSEPDGSSPGVTSSDVQARP